MRIKKMQISLLAISLFVFLFSLFSFAATVPAIQTSVDRGICSINIDGFRVSQYSCKGSRAPMLLSYSYLYELDKAVMVFIDKPTGNACDSGPLHVISTDQENKFIILKPIDFCGGILPKILSDSKSLIITTPSIIIEGMNDKIPSEKWVFEEDKIVKSQ